MRIAAAMILNVPKARYVRAQREGSGCRVNVERGFGLSVWAG
jgi:hypothetical protein